MRNIINLMLTANAALRTGNVLRVEGKPPYGVDSVYVDSGIRARTQPCIINYNKDGTKETLPITPSSALYCAMNAKSEAQVIAIAKQFQKRQAGV